MKEGEKAGQKCLFNVASQPSSITRVQNGILLQSEAMNYVITDKLDVFSFKGDITQVNFDFVTFLDGFKSFQLKRHSFVDGLVINSINDQNHFVFEKDEVGEIDLKNNGKILDIIGKKELKRSWVKKQE